MVAYVMDTSDDEGMVSGESYERSGRGATDDVTGSAMDRTRVAA